MGSPWATAFLLAGLLVSTHQTAWAAPDTTPQTLKGAVERFHYSPEGRYEGIVLIGEKLAAEGPAVTMVDSHFVMEDASAVNGVKMP